MPYTRFFNELIVLCVCLCSFFFGSSLCPQAGICWYWFLSPPLPRGEGPRSHRNKQVRLRSTLTPRQKAKRPKSIGKCQRQKTNGKKANGKRQMRKTRGKRQEAIAKDKFGKRQKTKAKVSRQKAKGKGRW